METHDHTNIISRPDILLGSYCSQRIPYLTVLLASRYNPLAIITGKPRMGEEENVSTIITSSSRRSPTNRKAIQDTSGLDKMIKSVVKFCKGNSGGGSNNHVIEGDSAESAVMTEDLPINDLYALIEQYNLIFFARERYV